MTTTVLKADHNWHIVCHIYLGGASGSADDVRSVSSHIVQAAPLYLNCQLEDAISATYITLGPVLFTLWCKPFVRIAT